MARLSPRGAALASVIAIVTLISALAGAFYSLIFFPETPFFAIWRGAVTGVSISLLITVFELSLATGPLRPMRHLPVGVLLLLRTVVYSVLIVVGYEFARLVATAPGEAILNFDRFFWQSLWLSIVVSFAINTGLEVSRLLGGEVLWGLLIGRYMLPRVEERIVLFVDMKESTRHAERLGDLKFHGLLNAFFNDVSHAVLTTRGSIYKYNGDAVIVLWRPSRGLHRGAALRCVRELYRRLQDRADFYRHAFGIVPGFRGGLHMGPVVVGEIGDQRREIAYSGDAMNTAARLEQATRERGVDFLVSAAVAEKLGAIEGVTLHSVGDVAVPGKAETLMLFAMEFRA